MRELHVVAVSEDGRHLVLAATADADKGTHRLPIDGRLAAALRGDLSKRPARAPRGEAAGRPPSSGAPSVRDIQARLRAGESPEQIADSAGVPVESVARFAGPVLSEREKIIERARATPLTRSRIGQSKLPLGEVLERQFAQMAAMRPESVKWSTRREESGTWLVEVTYVARNRSRSGSWRFDPRARTLVAVDSVSAALGHSDTVEGTAAAIPVGSVSPAHDAGRRVPPSVTRAGKASGKASGKAAGKAAGKGRARVAARTTGERASTSGATRTARPAGAPDGSPARPQGTRRPAPSPAAPPSLRVVPSAEQQPVAAEPAPAAKRPAGPRGRVSVPGWADVLLSTSPASARPSDEAAD